MVLMIEVTVVVVVVVEVVATALAVIPVGLKHCGPSSSLPGPHGVCPVGSVYFNGLFNTKAYLFNACGSAKLGTRVSAEMKRPSLDHLS
jgi:hypothetical protein